MVVVVKVKSSTCKQRAGKLEMSRAGDDQMPRSHQTDKHHLLHVTKQTLLCVHQEAALVSDASWIDSQMSMQMGSNGLGMAVDETEHGQW